MSNNVYCWDDRVSVWKYSLKFHWRAARKCPHCLNWWWHSSFSLFSWLPPRINGVLSSYYWTTSTIYFRKSYKWLFHSQFSAKITFYELYRPYFKQELLEFYVRWWTIQRVGIFMIDFEWSSILWRVLENRRFCEDALAWATSRLFEFVQHFEPSIWSIRNSIWWERFNVRCQSFFHFWWTFSIWKYDLKVKWFHSENIGV